MNDFDSIVIDSLSMFDLARRMLHPPMIRFKRPGGRYASDKTAPTDPLEAFKASLMEDPTNTLLSTRPRIAPLVPGELRLARELLRSALIDAQRKVDTQRRRDARAWLQDASALLSARACFESLDIDYAAAKERLVRQWAAGRTVTISREIATRNPQVRR